MTIQTVPGRTVPAENPEQEGTGSANAPDSQPPFYELAAISMTSSEPSTSPSSQGLRSLTSGARGGELRSLEEEKQAWKEAGLSRKLAFRELGDWATADALIEQLGKMKLLGEKFLYTAADPADLPILREHGTYRFDHDRNPLPEVFCCEYVTRDGEKFVTQVGDGGDPDTRFALWDYVNQNCGDLGSAIIVWNRDKLTRQGGAEFHFADPAHPHAAIAKVIIFSDLTV